MKINTEEEYQKALQRKADLIATTANEYLTENTDFATLRMAIKVYEKKKEEEEEYKKSLPPNKFKRQAGIRKQMKHETPTDTYSSYTASSQLTKEMSNTYAHTHHKKNSSPGNYSHLKRTQKTYPKYVPMNNHNYPIEDDDGIYNTLRDEGF